MIFSKLFISNNIEVNFHPGINIILGKNRGDGGDTLGDASDIDQIVSDTNGLGKTLIVSILKHVLGGDTETTLNSNFFEQNKLWAFVEIEKNTTLTVGRPLWSPLSDNLYIVFEGDLKTAQDELGKANIMLQNIVDPKVMAQLLDKSKSPIRPLTKLEFRNFIGKYENIDYSKSNITLSALLDFMIRDEKVGFTDIISRIRRQQWLQFRSIQYLFGLPATIEEECKKLEAEIAENQSVLDAHKKILAAKNISGVDSIENLKRTARQKLQKVQEDIEQVKVAASLEAVRQEYFDTKSHFSKINSELNTKYHYLKGYQENLSQLSQKSKAINNLLKVDEFYNNLIEFFPEQLKSNLTEFNNFFGSVGQDRDKYYVDLISEIKSDIKYLENERKKLEPKLEDLARNFRSTNVIRDISILTASEDDIRSELRRLDELKEVLIQCEQIEERIEDLNKLRHEAVSKGKALERANRDARTKIINLFHDIVSEVYGIDDGILEFDYVSEESSSLAGRTDIACSIPSQGSHGRTYAKINIFDFVWFLRERNTDEFDPGFLIHDGSYAKISREVKLKMLEFMKARIGKKQYIITLNEGEIDIDDEIRSYVCHELDGSQVSGKFMGAQFE